jgi:uncharacterized protein
MLHMSSGTGADVRKDAHVHLWPVQFTPKALHDYFARRGMSGGFSRAVSADGVLDLMDANGIETSVVSGVPYTGLADDTVDSMNDYTRDQVGRSPDRLLGLCVVNPRGGAASITKVRRLIEEKGFRGVKLHPAFQQCFVNDPQLYPLYELMQGYRLPVLFHSGPIGIAPAKDKYAAIEQFDEVACDFPSLPMLLGHGGRPQYAQAANLLRKHANIAIDLSANFARLAGFESSPLQELLYSVKTLAGSFQRVLFGSDYPIYSQAETIRAFEAATAALNGRFPGFVSDEDHRLISRGNFDAFFAAGE